MSHDAVQDLLAKHATAGGKKNWLFIGHPDASRGAAILYSIIVSCLRHGKGPATYLREVLTRLPAMIRDSYPASIHRFVRLSFLFFIS